MAFIIPNATDTASGAKYQNLDQAEPDSLDFEILGNAGYSGVVSGCEVTALAASNTSVTVSGGVVVLAGQPYIVSGQSTFALPVAPTDARFDLIVVRVSGGTANLTTVVGNDELTNPEFPPSQNTLAAGATFDPLTNIDLSTDVVLASIYRQSTQNITTSRITDRRLMVTSSIVNQGTTAPSAGEGYKGSLYYRTNIPEGTTASGVYVKNSLGTWIELAQNTGPQIPVGSVIAWLSTSSVPAGYLEANGQTVSRSTYSELFGVLGTTYGAGDGSTTFSLPNLNAKHLKGTTTANAVGGDVGNDSTTLSTANMPAHTHTLAGHTHTVSHSHTIAHNHSVSITAAGTHGHNTNASGNTSDHTGHYHADGNYSGTTSTHNGHSHTFSGNTSNVAGSTGNAGAHGHSLIESGNNNVIGPVYRTSGYFTTGGAYHGIEASNSASTFQNSSGPWDMGVVQGSIGVNAVGDHTHNVAGHSHTTSGNTGNAGNHSHTLDVSGNSSTGGSHSHSFSGTGTAADAGSHGHTANAGNSNAADTGNTNPTTSASNVSSGSAGSGTPFTNVPDSTYVRWLIRATGTVNATAQDGSDILSEAREEVVTIELAGSGALPASQVGAAYYRMPWAATLTAVKANRNGTNTNGAVTIDVNEGGTSVLSTEITIDVGESSSLTAATPAVISDNTVANDALLTFDIDSANTSDEGPLTVTLYFTRED